MTGYDARLVRRTDGYWLYFPNGDRQWLANTLTTDRPRDDLVTAARKAVTVKERE